MMMMMKMKGALVRRQLRDDEVTWLDMSVKCPWGLVGHQGDPGAERRCGCSPYCSGRRLGVTFRCRGNLGQMMGGHAREG